MLWLQTNRRYKVRWGKLTAPPPTAYSNKGKRLYKTSNYSSFEYKWPHRGDFANFVSIPKILKNGVFQKMVYFGPYLPIFSELNHSIKNRLDEVISIQWYPVWALILIHMSWVGGCLRFQPHLTFYLLFICRDVIREEPKKGCSGIAVFHPGSGSYQKQYALFKIASKLQFLGNLVRTTWSERYRNSGLTFCL